MPLLPVMRAHWCAVALLASSSVPPNLHVVWFAVNKASEKATAAA